MSFSWSELRYYEDKESLKRLTSAKLGYNPNSNKCDQIIACLHIARDYYESANTASLTIAPLLLYYGSTHLAKALTLIFGGRRYGSLNALGNSHGVMMVAPSDGKTGLKDFACQISQRRGVFYAFLDTFSYDIKLRVLDMDEIRLKADGPKEFLGKQITLEDLFLIIPELKKLCLKTFGIHTRAADAIFRYANILHDDSQEFYIVIDDICKSDLGSPPHYSPEWGFVRDNEDMASCWTTIKTIPTRFRRWCELGESPLGSDPTIIARINLGPEDKLLISTWIADYLGLYILGSIVRYYPDLWSSMVSRKTNSQILAIIEQFINRNKESLPTQTLQILDKHSVVNGKFFLPLAELPHGIKVLPDE